VKSGETFIDEATISVSAGDGGDGCASVRREKFVPRGGPDGGDGGCGGSVEFVADRNLATLLDQKLRPEIHADPGAPGEGSRRTGRDGRSIEVRLPVGTLVYDLPEAGEHSLLADLACDGDRVLVARGGRGGRGNSRFATATRQTPEYAERGRPGRIRSLRLSLKLLADVGFVGLPNAGKSTLLRRVSAARPRVANYPFTTLVPSLGVVESDDRRFVVADIPGLIEGASRGVGLGDRFLRHVERTRVLVHLVDAGSFALAERDLVADYETVRGEIEAYGASLAERSELIALTKIDLVADRSALDPIEKSLRERGVQVLRVSSATGEGIPELVRAMDRALTRADAAAEVAEP
jgi:GTP-binding protein